MNSEFSHHSLIWFLKCSEIGFVLARDYPSIRHVNWEKFLAPIDFAMSPSFGVVTPQTVYKYDAAGCLAVGRRWNPDDRKLTRAAHSGSPQESGNQAAMA